jgi:phosphoribosylformylglycinamidine cyclo-ligase
LLRQLLVGIRSGAEESGCLLISGETGDIPELLQKQGDAAPFDLVVASLGLARENELIRGQGLKEGDLVIGVKSSGVHSNGLTLARKVLLKKWGGLYKEDTKIDSLSGTVLGELLTPTRIYVAAIKHLRSSIASGMRAAVHVTGDAYLKLTNLFRYNPGVGFDLYNFDVPPIFNLIQDAARRKRGPISDKEMFETFNMGYGFLLVVEKTIADTCIDFIRKRKLDGELIGHVTRNSNKIVVRYRKKKIVLR